MMEKYEKIRVVGRGANGTVHLCRRLNDKKLVIIKEIPVEQMTKDERQTALNEVKVLAMLHHINIIEYYENFLEDKALMIVMEYAQGGTLLEYLQCQDGKFLEEEEILKLFAQMVLSLQHVHSKQILHRDLKTQNILLDKKKEMVKISDFGISKVLSSKSKAYTLEHLVTSHQNYVKNLPALILKIMRGTFTPISDHYSDALRSLILGMLHLNPERRPRINQVFAFPVVIDALMHLHTDVGKVMCSKVHPALLHMSKGGKAIKDGANWKHRDIASVFAWGGCLLHPTALSLPSLDARVVQVCVGRTQRAAVTKHGYLLVWECVYQHVGASSGVVSQRSVDNACPYFVPRYIEGQSAVSIQHVSCGDFFTACLTDRGILMTFGSGSNGCLGHGNYHDIQHAKMVEALLGYEVVQVSCGASHIAALTNEHEAFAWGRCDNGRLGIDVLDQECITTPQPVPIADTLKPVSVYCGLDCSVIVTLSGGLLCSGSNRYNKLSLDKMAPGHTVNEVHKFSPVTDDIIGALNVQHVALGSSHTAVVTVDGKCYTFGSNQCGQLGYNKSQNDRKPAMVTSLTSYTLSTVACGDVFTVAVSNKSS